MIKTTRNIVSLAAFAALSLILSVDAGAAGVFGGYPAAVPPLTDNECLPADTNLTQGLTPATECVTPGNIAGIATQNALGNYSNIPIGSVAYASLGTDTTDVNGQLWLSSFQMPLDATVTGIKCLAGGTATTDNVIGALYKVNLSGDTTKATLVANSALAGALLAGASTFQTYTFLTPYAAKAGPYFMVLQGNGTTAGAIATVAASTYVGITAGSIAGTFGTLPATITFPTTFTANKAPICFTF